MKNTPLVIGLTFLIFFVSSCQQLQDAIPTQTGITDTEIVAGLKEALNVGMDTTVKITSKLNGYLKDEAIKLLLPPEALSAITKLKSTSIGNSLYEATMKSLESNMIESLNHAAEDAAIKAKPIFINAVTSMTIADGRNILLGGVDTAATSYLRKTTYSQLQAAFSPEIDASLNKKILLNKSTNEYWKLFVDGHNLIANSPFNSPLGLSPITSTSLGIYATDKALKGLFIKVADEEKKIRKDPFKRVTDILKKVFGELDKK